MDIDLADYAVQKQERLWQPVAATGDRLYTISSQNGLYPDPWDGHVPHEMLGVWSHPIKLLDGVWFAVIPKNGGVLSWLSEADTCRVTPTGVNFLYNVGPLTVLREDFVPDSLEGMLITLEIQARGSFDWPLEVVVAARSDLRPAWLGESVGMADGPDKATYEPERQRLVFTDENPDWAVVLTTNPPPEAASLTPKLPFHTAGQGVGASLRCLLRFDGDNRARLQLYIAGSSRGLQHAHQVLDRLMVEREQLIAKKQIQASTLLLFNRLASPNASVDKAFAWAKLNAQMLVREVPTIGRGTGAGLPTYPWWFGVDSEYAVEPMVQSGLFGLSGDTLNLLRSVSEQENSAEPGRVVHEVSTTGVVHNLGNLVETPLFTRAVHHHWLWTGDAVWLSKMYPFCKQGLLEYTLGTCDLDGDLCPSGSSLIETLEMHAGFECIDPACYTWEALNCLKDMATALGDQSVLLYLEKAREQLGRCIREEWWLDSEGLFADVRATRREVEAALLDMTSRAAEEPDAEHLQSQSRNAHAYFKPWLEHYSQKNERDDLDLPWLLKHWVVLCPMEVRLATHEQAKRSLARLSTAEFCTREGMRLRPGDPMIMSINTGLLAVANARYGRMDEALRLLHCLSDTLPTHMPGAVSEILPDVGCFLQLWSNVGIITPIVEGFAGIQPRAAERLVRVTPCLPEAWPSLALHDVRVGKALATLKVQQTPTYVRVEATCSNDFDLELGLCLPFKVTDFTFSLDGVVHEYEVAETTRGREVYTRVNGKGVVTVALSRS